MKTYIKTCLIKISVQVKARDHAVSVILWKLITKVDSLRRELRRKLFEVVFESALLISKWDINEGGFLNVSCLSHVSSSPKFLTRSLLNSLLWCLAAGRVYFWLLLSDTFLTSTCNEDSIKHLFFFNWFHIQTERRDTTYRSKRNLFYMRKILFLRRILNKIQGKNNSCLCVVNSFAVMFVSAKPGFLL
jgi:hypothetical protein